MDDPRALALGEQAEQEGGGGGGGGGEQQPGHREEEAGQDRDVEQVGLGGQGGRLEEESQAGGEQGKMARQRERGVEGDGGQQPGEGEHQVESHPGTKQISEMFTIFVLQFSLLQEVNLLLLLFLHRERHLRCWEEDGEDDGHLVNILIMNMIMILGGEGGQGIPGGNITM